MDHDRLVNVIVELAVRAGEEILTHFNPAGVQTRRKSDGSPVTVADMAADNIIQSGLAAAYPDVPTISEERLDSQVAEAGRCFIVDPLDGTRGFSRGSAEFTVNIAYVENGVPKRGVVFAPAQGRLFYNGAKGKVVEKRREPGSKDFETVAAASPHNRSDVQAIGVLASWSAHRNEMLDEFLRPYDVASVRFVSSSLKFCLIANGEAELYPRFGRTMEWDTAAGHALVNASGGDVLRLDDLKPLTYGKRGYENPFFVARASGIELHRH